MVKYDTEVTQKMIAEFDSICEKYYTEEVDVRLLRKGVKEVIDNYC